MSLTQTQPGIRKLIASFFLTLFCTAHSALAQPGNSDWIDDSDILLRGPVHEAFAEPISYDPEPGPTAPVAPPAPIDELPPDQRPDGINVTWIPGYWLWDDEVNDFLWISGIWRDVPPGREWIAGYWIRAGGAYQWIPGYWDNVNSVETIYLPEPPASVETGAASMMAPSPDEMYVPGTWVWTEQRYLWRPGYWQPGRPDWVWVPAHYVWTPRGYIFVDGYWDHTVDRRGVLFAPVRFDHRYRSRTRFVYTPTTVINPVSLVANLFLRPSHNHYYFGDYYDERYARRGYRPWFTVRSSRKYYDPIFAHHRWSHRNDRDWDGRLRRDFERRRNDRDHRPAHTWADQRRWEGDGRGRDDRHRSIGQSLLRLVQDKDSPRRMLRVDDRERSRLSERRNDIDRLRNDRRKAEARTDDKPDRRYTTRTRPARVTRSKSPISARPGNDLKGSARPPERTKPPKVDSSVQPKRRSATVRAKSDGKSKDDNRGNRRDRDGRRDKD